MSASPSYQDIISSSVVYYTLCLIDHRRLAADTVITCCAGASSTHGKSSHHVVIRYKNIAIGNSGKLQNEMTRRTDGAAAPCDRRRCKVLQVLQKRKISISPNTMANLAFRVSAHNFVSQAQTAGRPTWIGGVSRRVLRKPEGSVPN